PRDGYHPLAGAVENGDLSARCFGYAGINASVPALWTNHEALFPNSREPKRHGDKADNPSDHPPKTIGRSKPIRRLSRHSPVRARRQPCPPAGGGGGGGGPPRRPAPRGGGNSRWNTAGW